MREILGQIHGPRKKIHAQPQKPWHQTAWTIHANPSMNPWAESMRARDQNIKRAPQYMNNLKTAAGKKNPCSKFTHPCRSLGHRETLLSAFVRRTRRRCSAECVRVAPIAMARSVALSLACICALSFTLRLVFSASDRPRRGLPRAGAGAAAFARRFDSSVLRGEVGAGGARLAQCCGRAPKAHATGCSWNNVSVTFA